MTGATHGAGTDYPSGAPDFIQGFQYGFVLLSLNFLCNICHPLSVLVLFLYAQLHKTCTLIHVFIFYFSFEKKKQ
jgi:hypothetical protein